MTELSTQQQRNVQFLKSSSSRWPVPQPAEPTPEPSQEKPATVAEEPFGVVQRVELLESQVESQAAANARLEAYLRWLAGQMGFRP